MFKGVSSFIPLPVATQTFIMRGGGGGVGDGHGSEHVHLSFPRYQHHTPPCPELNPLDCLRSGAVRIRIRPPSPQRWTSVCLCSRSSLFIVRFADLDPAVFLNADPDPDADSDLA